MAVGAALAAASTAIQIGRQLADLFGGGDDEDSVPLIGGGFARPSEAARENAFRAALGSFAFKAPTGVARDSQINQRNAQIRNALGPAAFGWLQNILRTMGVPESANNASVIWGIDSAQIAGIPFGGGWPQFDLGNPSPWNVLRAALRTTDQQLFDALRAGPQSAPAPVRPPRELGPQLFGQRETDMGVGSDILNVLGGIGDAADILRGGSDRSAPQRTTRNGVIDERLFRNVEGPLGGGGFALDLPGSALDVDAIVGGHQGHSRFLVPTRPRVGMAKEVQVEGPDGRIHTYRNKGRALLYADDLGAVKRVKRVASRAGRVCGTRRGRR